MKTIVHFSFLLFCLFLLSMTAYPQLNFEENFDYPAGDSLNTHGWVPHSQPGVNPVMIVAGNLSYSGYASSGIGNSVEVTGSVAAASREDLTATFNIDSVSNVYCSFLVSVASIGAQVDYFFHFREDPVPAILRGRVMLQGNGAGGFNFGISKGSTTNITWDTTARTFNETYLIVLKYEYVAGATNDLIHLFVNPLLSGTEPATPDATVPDTTASDIIVNAVALRQGSRDYAVQVDGIRVSTSWIDALNLMPISQAREDLNIDLIPDRLTDTVTVIGIVISPNFQTNNRSYYINDGTGGIATFKGGLTSPALNLGDEVWVNGTIDHFNGLTEIVPLTDASVVVLSTGNTIPDPIVLSPADYFADPEAYEGFLVAFVCLNKISGTWPASTSATLKFSDGVDTIDIRIDSDTDIDNNTEPTYPRDIIGIGSQFNTYQILPRYYATDFLPCGTIPVELVSFSANFVDGSVMLAWKTATETNNLGFSVQRSLDGKSFNEIGFVKGNGTSTEAKSYSFIDTDLGTAANLYYRLRQTDYNGNANYTSVINVEVTNPISFSLSQNYPNPFNPTTTIGYVLQEKSYAKLTVLNSLGEEVAVLVNEEQDNGYHKINFDGSKLSSGVYFYKIQAGNFVSTKKMLLLK